MIEDIVRAGHPIFLYQKKKFKGFHWLGSTVLCAVNGNSLNVVIIRY